ncbi:acyl-CoA thioesterase [Pseudomonas aegrilactucae]|uniref:Acyl-CoA thioesterase n=1 Tax=Pseudomonas aegrilactucae TaxID=2854028 RepID=A0A9Q2XJE5_9PSED|nr:thioesterase family protein [Pseudomonas aegrilactucae]MBV6287803.1 acyl-CoA thioesterase [Pseudomonas aegrilactucae]
MTHLPERHHYPRFQPLLTRWQDNDINGHIASATVYAFFDSAVQGYLIEHAGLDPQDGEVVGFVVSSGCDFFTSAAFPECLEVGLRVARVAGSSVEYELALFKVGQAQPSAAGRMVQVFVERASGQPASLPAALQGALQALQG